MTTKKIKLDTWHKNSVVVCANQGEVNSRFLEITLVNGGEPLNLEGTTVLIYTEKPDKNVIFNNCKIENADKGIISVELTSQMSALSGKLDCEIHIINREQSTLKIIGLQIKVMPCANSDSAVESTSEFTVLSDAIEKTLEIMDQYSEENIMGRIQSMDGEGSGLDADLLDGKHGSEYATKSQGTKADSAIQGIQGNGTTITPNENKIVNVTPANIGAVPTTRKVNDKSLSSDITLSYTDVGAAPQSHSSPNTTYGVSTASNYGHAMASSTTPIVAGTASVGSETAKFARGDHVHPVQTSVSGNAGTSTKLQTARTIATSAGATGTATSFDGTENITIPVTALDPNYLSSSVPISKGGTGATTAVAALTNLGASAEGHTHTFSSLTSKPTSLSGYGITDAVPNTRTVNNKALSCNISLTASDVGAATTAQGTKADSAIQGVKVNGTLLTPDSSKVVNVEATAINAATPEQGTKADSAIQGVKGNGTLITPDANKVVNITPTNIGAATSSHSHSEASTTAAGFLSTNDKTKLNRLNIASNGYLSTPCLVVGADTEMTASYSSANIGNLNVVSAANCLAAGYDCKASGNNSFSSGYECTASGWVSAAIGNTAAATGNSAISAGHNTTARAYNFACGRFNTSTASSDSGTSGDMFIVGNGTSTTPKNAFRVTASGSVLANSSYSSTGADYAELFEWFDGNTNDEDRRGLFVTLDGDKIRLANSQDKYILGIVSGNPSVIGDNFDDDWCEKYLTDVFGTPIFETKAFPEIKDEDGNIIQEAYEDKTFVLNPSYDSAQIYIPRTKRKEWATIGIVGKLVVIDDGTCVVNRYCYPSQNGVATNSMDITNYRVLKRIDENHIQVFIK